MKYLTKIDLQKLYEIDDHRWLEENIKLLKQKRFREVDLDNLIEELESLAKRDKLAVRSLLEQIIRHILLLQYWDVEYKQNYRHWQAEIFAFRTQLNHKLTTNLTNYLNEELPSIYQEARGYVMKKSGLDVFPLECPYNLENLLDANY